MSHEPRGVSNGRVTRLFVKQLVIKQQMKYQRSALTLCQRKPPVTNGFLSQGTGKAGNIPLVIYWLKSQIQKFKLIKIHISLKNVIHNGRRNPMSFKDKNIQFMHLKMEKIVYQRNRKYINNKLNMNKNTILYHKCCGRQEDEMRELHVEYNSLPTSRKLVASPRNQGFGIGDTGIIYVSVIE